MTTSQRISLNTIDSIHLVQILYILYCKCDNNSTTFFLTNHKPIVVLRCIKEVVKQLVYLFFKENEETGDFERNELIADVASNAEEMTLNIDYIFYGYDRNNLPEDAALPPNINYENLLYPEKENTFRIAGDKIAE